MFSLGSKLLLLFLLAFPCGLVSVGHVAADADSAEDVAEDPEAAVDEEEDDGDEMLVEEDQMRPTDGDEEDMDETDDKPLSSHPDADTAIIFVTWRRLFPANEIVKFLVGFTNKGSQEFTVKSLEASFRYPQEFQVYIQNAALIMNLASPVDRSASVTQTGFLYICLYGSRRSGVDEEDTGRPITAPAVALFSMPVMFMYIFLGGLVVLMLFGMYQVLETRTTRLHLEHLQGNEQTERPEQISDSFHHCT
ncbi:hypothetical protein fugu_004685 [Takifugu bimaculatus]|uniref:Translocon-associated protein subunit alpha n=1 Tax=Takifugu bimaculatus TaxID=433685 RepID=A0A4Z2B7R7_9TELE|nr:hypothetical protein fugu_004685 [Takifugu bimaculatus]